jgi:hypothetical protein
MQFDFEKGYVVDRGGMTSRGIDEDGLLRRQGPSLSPKVVSKAVGVRFRITGERRVDFFSRYSLSGEFKQGGHLHL